MSRKDATWRGFTVESKEFCGYAAKSRKGHIAFWFAFIPAACRFYWYGIRNRFLGIVATWLGR